MKYDTIVRKLTSRKFWMAVIGFVTGLLVYLGKSKTDADTIGSLILSAASVVAYMIGEGLADSKDQMTLISPDQEKGM